MNISTQRSSRLLLVAALAFPATASATVSVPFDIWLNGTLDITYASDGAARLDPALYVDSNEAFGPGALATVYVPPGDVAAATGLGFEYAYGDTPDGLEVRYSVSNNTGVTWTGLRLFAAIAGDPFDAFGEIPAIHAGGLAAGDPAGWGADDYFLGNLFLGDILNDAALDDTDHCAGALCDAEVALQWDLDALPDGTTWVVRVLLSDAGKRLGNVAIDLALADAVGALAPAQVLTVSGNAALVPIPGAFGLLAAALPLLAGRRVRRRPGGAAGPVLN